MEENSNIVPEKFNRVEKNQFREIVVYHDESGDYGYSNWVFTGLFWIDASHLRNIDKELKAERDKENYFGEIHYRRFPSSFGGEFGAKARIARKWFNIWKNKWIYRSWFNVLAVNIKHHAYDQSRFTKDFHAYNRFTAIALKGGLAWHFNKYDSLLLRICSDEKLRRPQGLLGNGIRTDNFEIYLMKRLHEDTKNYKGPRVILTSPIKCLKPSKTGPYSNDEELIQLCDLLLGAVAAAIEAKPKKKTKRWFGRKISFLIDDSRLEPWNQTLNLHRRFSVSYFPNDKGQIYSHGPLMIRENKAQLSLF